MNWVYWSLLSAFFAGLTAVLAKASVSGVDSNLATAVRTAVDPYGQQAAKATESTEILCHDLDFQAVENFRRIWPFFRDRRFDAYGDLTKRWRS